MKDNKMLNIQMTHASFKINACNEDCTYMLHILYYAKGEENYHRGDECSRFSWIMCQNGPFLQRL